MPRTANQVLGAAGEDFVVKKCSCPRCKREKTLRRVPVNFKCADIICDFCGYLAQVKTTAVARVDVVPKTVLGAAWGPQKERMAAGVYFPLFLVLISKRQRAIYYLPADLQKPDLFVARKALSASARRAGWQGFYYSLGKVSAALVRIF